MTVTNYIGDLAADTTTVEEAVRREVIAARLLSHEWPACVLKIVSVNIETGAPKVFVRVSGVDLVDAVATSCAGPGMWTAGEHR